MSNFGCRNCSRSQSRTNLLLRKVPFFKQTRITVKRSHLVELVLSPPITHSRGVVMVIPDEFKSEPCLTIHYTYNKILEGLR